MVAGDQKNAFTEALRFRYEDIFALGPTLME